MSASIARLLSSVPVPLFGSAGTAVIFAAAKAKALPRMAGWGLPLGVGALWFVWPAVDDGWKVEMGLKADPEAAAKAAEEAAAAAPKKVELPAEAMAKVEDAYKAGETDGDKILAAAVQSGNYRVHVATEGDKALAKAVQSGDYSGFEAQWEAFVEKAVKPGDDDDEDEDDDDDDDDEDEDEDDDDE